MGNKKSKPKQLPSSVVRSCRLRRWEVKPPHEVYPAGNPDANVLFLRKMSSTQASDVADALIEEGACFDYRDAQSLINVCAKGDYISSRRVRAAVRHVRSPRKKHEWETLPKDQLTPEQLAKRKALKKRKLRYLRKKLGDEEYRRRVREHNTWVRREKALNSKRSPSN